MKRNDQQQHKKMNISYYYHHLYFDDEFINLNNRWTSNGVCMKREDRDSSCQNQKVFAFQPSRLYSKSDKAWRMEPTISCHLIALTNYTDRARTTLYHIGKILAYNKSYELDAVINHAPAFLIKKGPFFKKVIG